MQATGTPTTGTLDIESIPKLRRGVRGMRAVIDFAPKPTSPERLVAGIVTRLDDGTVQSQCAIDPRKMELTFGPESMMLYTIAHHLCASLAHHWETKGNTQDWVSPFEGARISDLSEFSANSAQQAHEQMLARVSSIYSLMQDLEIITSPRESGIVQRVRAAIRKDKSLQHLGKRFSRPLMVHGDALPLKVDFLGQNYACYFLQISKTERGLASNTERAFGKLFELQALRVLVNRREKSIGLLDDEKPKKFELLMVGNKSDPVQAKAINQVEALANRDDIRVRLETDPSNAAHRVATMERLAA